jgi:hypothetical protein
MKPDKILISLSFLVILTTFSWITSCTHNADLSGLPEVCFERDVLIIFTSSCATGGCHNGSGEGPALNNYTNIMKTIVPGDPYGSSSYKAIITTWGENKMPPDQPISLDNRTMIRVWIEQGALNLTCTPVTKADDGGFYSEHRTGQLK